MKAGVDQLFVEQVSGTKASRPEWNRVKEVLRAGDTLVITRLDRLGRSTRDLGEISQWLRDNDVNLKATDQPIDTSSAEGRMFYTILAAFAEFEHELIVARTLDGLAAARARGRNGGRKPKVSARDAAHMRALYEDRGNAQTVTQIAERFRVSRPTVYRALQRG